MALGKYYQRRIQLPYLVDGAPKPSLDLVSYAEGRGDDQIFWLCKEDDLFYICIKIKKIATGLGQGYRSALTKKVSDLVVFKQNMHELSWLHVSGLAGRTRRFPSHSLELILAIKAFIIFRSQRFDIPDVRPATNSTHSAFTSILCIVHLAI